MLILVVGIVRDDIGEAREVFVNDSIESIADEVATCAGTQMVALTESRLHQGIIDITDSAGGDISHAHPLTA